METLEEINKALAALPTTPETDEQLLARSELMAAYIELEQKLKAPPPPRPEGNVIAFVPDNVSAVYTADGIMRCTEIIDGRAAVRLKSLGQFRDLMRGSVNGLDWEARNPHLIELICSANVTLSPIT